MGQVKHHISQGQIRVPNKEHTNRWAQNNVKLLHFCVTSCMNIIDNTQTPANTKMDSLGHIHFNGSWYGCLRHMSGSTSHSSVSSHSYHTSYTSQHTALSARGCSCNLQSVTREWEVRTDVVYILETKQCFLSLCVNIHMRWCENSSSCYSVHA